MEVKNIPVERIYPSPMNPRKTFDETSIEELSQNIERQGLLQPITVRATEYEDYLDESTLEVYSMPSKYEIICGERRYRACKMLAERKPNFEVLCIVKDMTDDEAFEAMITENLQRQDVDPVEEAIAFSLLLKNGKSIQDIALKFGKSTRFVQDRTKLTNLIPSLLEALRQERIPISGAMMLAKLDEAAQKDFEEEFDEESTYSDIKDFVNRSFGVLKEQAFFSNDGTFGDYPLCSTCEFNTANHGCLFHEMKSDKEKCTHTDCMEKKSRAYIFNKFNQEKDNFVKEGENLEYGKMLVVMDTPESYWSPSRKKTDEEMRAFMAENKIQIAQPYRTFDHRCYYDENDSRIQELLEKHEIYTCIECMDGFGNPSFRKLFYYVKKQQKVETDGTINTQAFQIDAKKKRNIELQEEKTNEALVARFSGLPKYTGKTEPLSVVERNVLNALILEECGYLFIDQKTGGFSVGKKYDSNLDYIKRNPDDINSIYRAFIKEKLSKGNGQYMGKTQREGLREILLEQDNEHSQKLIDDIAATYKKKNDRLDEKLKK